MSCDESLWDMLPVDVQAYIRAIVIARRRIHDACQAWWSKRKWFKIESDWSKFRPDPIYLPVVVKQKFTQPIIVKWASSFKSLQSDRSIVYHVPRPLYGARGEGSGAGTVGTDPELAVGSPRPSAA